MHISWAKDGHYKICPPCLYLLISPCSIDTILSTSVNYLYVYKRFYVALGVDIQQWINQFFKITLTYT